jgi:sulfur-oxidizing protein SoxY
MDQLRRTLLKGSTLTLIAPWIGSGLLQPGRVLAAEWNRNAFTARSLQEALKASGNTTASESRDILIQAPEIAENGSKVEIEITSHLANTRSLSIFAEKNPMPLAATLEFSSQAIPYTRIQLKLAESTRLRVIARTADGKNHVAFREIKVTLGGCGG